MTASMATFYPRLLKPPKQSFFLFGARGTGKTTWARQAFPLTDPSLFGSRHASGQARSVGLGGRSPAPSQPAQRGSPVHRGSPAALHSHRVERAQGPKDRREPPGRPGLDADDVPVASRGARPRL